MPVLELVAEQGIAEAVDVVDAVGGVRVEADVQRRELLGDVLEDFLARIAQRHHVLGGAHDFAADAVAILIADFRGARLHGHATARRAQLSEPDFVRELRIIHVTREQRRRLAIGIGARVEVRVARQLEHGALLRDETAVAADRLVERVAIAHPEIVTRGEVDTRGNLAVLPQRHEDRVTVGTVHVGVLVGGDTDDVEVVVPAVRRSVTLLRERRRSERESHDREQTLLHTRGLMVGVP